MTAAGVEVRSAAVQAPGRWSYLGPIISALCFVHCIGLAVLAPILPGAVALLSGVTWLEPCLWFASVAGTGASLHRARARPGAVLVWLLAAAVGALGFALDADRLVQISLGVSVAIQLTLVARRWTNHQSSCSANDCQVCDHERNYE